ILDVLRRATRGERQRAISRVTGHSRSTIRRWLKVARHSGWQPCDGEPGEGLAREIATQVRPVRDEASPGESQARLLPHRAQIEAWLSPEDERRGLRLTKVQQLLARKGVVVPYSSLHRFAVERCGFADRRRLTVRRADVDPGELAEVDFGKLGLVWDPASERRRVHHALIVTLVYSRHQYVYVTPSQKVPDLIAGLEEAWAFFGGCPARVVLDNLKAAVTKADRYDPIFQRTFAEYAGYRGFVIDAAVPRSPTGKPVVERGVQYMRESFFRGESWLDRDHVQREAIRWCLETAGQRVHGTTRRRPRVVFENEEHPKLIALAKEPFDPPSWSQCKVHPDHHVQFLKGFYSAPTRHVGKQVWVRGDSKLVRIYVDGELVKTHERVGEGKRSTDYNDYPEELATYARRDPDALIREGQRQGTHIGRFLEKLLAGDFPWAKLRQGQKLLRLSNKYGRERLDAACRRAVYFELYNVKRVEDMVKAALERDATTEPGAPRGQLLLLPTPTRFQRPDNSFNHNAKEETHGDQSIAQDRDETPEALGTSRHAPRPGGVREEDETQ
ncbi:MAG: IS21 family transposase, partial [Deltaproteobacteria bacterium]|nr:IS21 family transposase [Deltaproteobacteria bacterium]